ncbi:hypothetical protein PUNSTDRAFT_48178, partial [Punctularia strigosozonata HHB-11173 SS5]
MKGRLTRAVHALAAPSLVSRQEPTEDELARSQAHFAEDKNLFQICLRRRAEDAIDMMVNPKMLQDGAITTPKSTVVIDRKCICELMCLLHALRASSCYFLVPADALRSTSIWEEKEGEHIDGFGGAGGVACGPSHLVAPGSGRPEDFHSSHDLGLDGNTSLGSTILSSATLHHGTSIGRRGRRKQNVGPNDASKVSGSMSSLPSRATLEINALGPQIRGTHTREKRKIVIYAWFTRRTGANWDQKSDKALSLSSNSRRRKGSQQQAFTSSERETQDIDVGCAVPTTSAIPEGFDVNGGSAVSSSGTSNVVVPGET